MAENRYDDGLYIEVAHELNRKRNPSEQVYLEKCKRIVQYLLMFRFTDDDGIGYALEQVRYESGKKCNHFPFVKRMIEQGLITKFHNGVIPNRLFMLTKKGRVFAEQVTGKSAYIYLKHYPTSYTKLPKTLSWHDLKVQLITHKVREELKGYARIKAILTANTLREFPMATVWGTIPDAIILFERNGCDDDEVVAIEYEATPKKKLDRYWQFKRYEELILERQVTHVVWAFFKDNHKELYQEQCLEPDRPMVMLERKKGQKRLVPSKVDSRRQLELKRASPLHDQHFAQFNADLLKNFFIFITEDSQLEKIPSYPRNDDNKLKFFGGYITKHLQKSGAIENDTPIKNFSLRLDEKIERVINRHNPFKIK